ncbi:MAG: winged helix DNA-binding domain-containing protein [Ardenticatenales bacterium]
MTTPDIPPRRLRNQRLTAAPLATPAAVVAWQGAVQAQDYAGARWAIGLRLRGAVDADVEAAFDEGSILRTHVLRPTWHFVAPADIRWLLALTAPRVHAQSAYMYRQAGLDAAIFARSHAALAGALEGGRHRTREELGEALVKAGVEKEGAFRLIYLLMHAELEGLIVSGPRRGKQHTYALLEERVPPAPTLDRDAALAELVRRYFTSHGPATPQDFAVWSGLTVTDGKRGIAMAGDALAPEAIDGTMYWSSPSGREQAASSSSSTATATAFLLPNYDEYFIGFKDRRAIGMRIDIETYHRHRRAIDANVIVVDGQVVGGWRRTLRAREVDVELNVVVPLSPAEQAAVDDAVARYGAFLGRSVATVTP